ncbi:NAP1-related protein 2 [Perilla frutescens var. frutescens]|nr:NAP1-related protein 2 [Perilla frutescens var. frutescens]
MVAKKPIAAAAEEADPIDHDDALLIAMEKLQQIQDELQKVNEDANEEILEIEQNYMEKRKPLYKRRNEIISEIPEFWLSTFLNHPTLENLLTEEDQKIFVYLDSINVEDFADPRNGYCITFKFKANPFFKNKKLIKTIKLDDRTMKSSGTTIHWKAGKGPAGHVAKKGSKRPLPSDSFFTWFSSPDKVEHDHLVAEIIKEEIWPNPIDHLNDLDDEDDYDYEDEDEDEEDEDEGDDDGDGDGF